MSDERCSVCKRLIANHSRAELEECLSKRLPPNGQRARFRHDAMTIARAWAQRARMMRVLREQNAQGVQQKGTP